MLMTDVIKAKRDGHELTKEQIEFFVNGYTANEIPDYQVSALLMAIYDHGMTDQETSDLAMTMLASGDKLDLSQIPGPKVDKHSTGGVGDKTSIPLAPLVASFGINVPMISGRGLGHTGGTLDKLEAIPGYKVEITEPEFLDQIKNHQAAIVGATGNIAPADKKIYALRDVTSTVDSIPLIAGSIMSKKIASGTDSLVLDVKTGSGAFMKTPEMSRKLAEALVQIGKNVGMNAMAVISDMNQPLGSAIGNSLEIEESIDILKGKGPEDITKLIKILGAQMLVLGDVAKTIDEGETLIQQAIDDGSGLAKFREMVTAQGGNAKVIDDYTLMPQAKYKIELLSPVDGYITEMEADQMGMAALMLGAGRTSKDDELDYSTGIKIHKKIGDPVKSGESLMTIYSNRENVDDVKNKILTNITIGEKVEKPELIHEIIK